MDIDTLQTLAPNPAKFQRKGRGYVDWKFSEVCAYLGYQAALEYVATMQRWHDFDKKYTDCELNTTYLRYVDACGQAKHEK